MKQFCYLFFSSLQLINILRDEFYLNPNDVVIVDGLNLTT